MSDQRFFNAHREIRATLVALVAVGVLAARSADAQDVQARQVAGDAATPSYQAWETHLAAGPASPEDTFETVIAVYNTSAFEEFGVQIGYAVGTFDGSQWVWSDGLIPLGPFLRSIDPSIAYDAANHHFLAAGMDTQVIVSSYQNNVDPTFDPWRPVTDWPPLHGIDKPWIVAGEAGEFYIVYKHTPPSGELRYAYLRTTNGGGDWFSDDIRTPDGLLVAEAGSRWIFPTVAADGTLYAMYVIASYPESPMRLGFIEGVDNAGGGVDFDKLMSGPTEELEVTLNRRNVSTRVPGGISRVHTIPQVAADPFDPDTLFLLYQDTATGDPSDTNVNIYLQVLTRDLVTGFWSAAPRVQVNDADDPGVDWDQFLPSITVDAAGRIHVNFYDDRRYEQDDGQTNPPPKFDVFYTWAPRPDPGQQPIFRPNERLYEFPEPQPDPPALDFGHNLGTLYRPGEYIGITSWQSTVWTSYAGSTAPSSPTTDTNESVIWSSRILFGGP